MLALLDTKNIQKELHQSKLPVLIACLRRTPESKTQKSLLEKLAHAHGNTLKIFVLEEDSSNMFNRSLHVYGTPTYILFKNGTEHARILGETDKNTLFSFINTAHLPPHFETTY